MSEINKLVYFLNSLKDTLPFEDEKDFREKIRTSKEFRIRVQKLVYLSKFFGWENSYHFNFHEHGPYSIELSEDYLKIDNEISMRNFNFKIEEFKEFISENTNKFLEATSTILYYLKKTKFKNKDNIVEIIHYLKPHIPKRIIAKSLDNIKRYNLFDKYPSNIPSLNKSILIDKIDGLQSIFEHFEICHNQTLILGSLEYLKLALNKENLNKKEKAELITTIWKYAEDIEEYYFKNYKLSNNFAYYDLSPLEDRFESLQDYLSKDLKIIPKLYDEDTDLTYFC
jgi:uncharacterized protein YwgA